MLFLLLVGFAVSTAATLYSIRFSRTHSRITGDHDFSGPQKFHARVVPRVGGAGIFVGFVAASACLAWQSRAEREMVGLLILCAIPAFAAGLWEDLTKRVSVSKRLFATSLSAALGALLLGATVSRTDIPGIDAVAALPIGAVLLAVFAVAGLVNSVNIIDGMHGLASMCVMLMLAGLAYISYQVGDTLLVSLSLCAIGALLGFFIWNYPNGLIFLGDGGAYFVGFVLAELSILLVHRNPEVSPLCPLLVCAYPILETVFSMYRRKVVRGRAMAMPDGIHLHSLIYRRLMRWAVGSKDAAILNRRNSMTAPYLWLLCVLCVLPGVFWWDSTPLLTASLALFAAVYVILYRQIVRFRTPRVLVRRRTSRLLPRQIREQLPERRSSL